MDQYSLRSTDENYNKFVITRLQTETCHTIWDNDNLISNYFKIPLADYREILKSQFGDKIKMEKFVILFDKNITIEAIMDVIDIVRVTSVMFEENKPKNRWAKFY